MKKYKKLGIYDFSDYAEEITGDDLFKINGGATMSSEDQAAMAEALKNGDKSTADQIRSQYETQTAPSQRGGTGGSGGSSIPSSSGNGSGGNSGNTKKESGSGGSGGPSGGNNPGGPSGPSGPSAPEVPAEVKENPYAYAAYMSLQGKAKEEGDPDKYKGYNVLGSGKVQVTIVKENKEISSLDIKEYLIPEKTLNRQEKEIKDVKAIVIHWTEAPKQDPKVTIDYWATTSRIGSAHYVIGIDGKIYQAIPENEQARHAGNNEGKYMDKATELFGDGINPNIYSIGIEMEPLTVNGDFSSATYSSAVTLASSLCNKYSLNPETSLIRHYDVTGKNCPKYFVNYGNEWEIFKTDVLKVMGQ